MSVHRLAKMPTRPPQPKLRAGRELFRAGDRVTIGSRDEPLYRIKALSPLMWLVERTISTPSTHSAHHGKHVADGITNYKGNFGNLLFFWDVLFGTAKITRRYPDEIGVENLPPVTAGAQLLWPLVRG